MTQWRKAFGALAVAVVAASGLVTLGATGQVAAAAASGTGTGYLHTSGNKILDSTGATVRFHPASTGSGWRPTTRPSTAVAGHRDKESKSA